MTVLKRPESVLQDNPTASGGWSSLAHRIEEPNQDQLAGHDCHNCFLIKDGPDKGRTEDLLAICRYVLIPDYASLLDNRSSYPGRLR